MKRRLAIAEVKHWAMGFDSKEEAIDQVRQALQCSWSKADKIVGCRYPSVPVPLEQEALASLLGVPRDTLYPVVGKPRVKTAS